MGPRVTSAGRFYTLGQTGDFYLPRLDGSLSPLVSHPQGTRLGALAIDLEDQL